MSESTDRPGSHLEIVISIDALDPPTGQVRLVGHEAWVGFTGWLGLLRALDDMIGPTSPPLDDV